MSLTGALALVLSLPASTAELKASPGGKIRIDYGAAQWQEAWEERIFDNMIWRLSAGNENRAVVEPGLIFDDAVVFPGTYNLGLANRGVDEWGLVFHNDGLNWNAGPCEAETMFVREWFPEGKLAAQLSIELGRRAPTTGTQDEEPNDDPYQWTIDLGPRHLTKSFRTCETESAKGKVGKYAFGVTWLARADLDRVHREIDDDELIVARIESKHLEHPYRAAIRGGDPADLAIWPPDAVVAAPVYLEATPTIAKKPSKRIELAVKSGKKHATLTFTIGDRLYAFELPPKMFEKSSLRDD